MIYEFYVPNLVCGGCARRLTQGLTSRSTIKLENSHIQCDTIRHRVRLTLIDETLSDKETSTRTDNNSAVNNTSLKNTSDKKTLNPQIQKRLLNTLTDLGFPAYPLSEDKSLQKLAERDFLKRIFVAALGTMQVMMFSVSLYMQKDMPQAWIQTFHWFSLWVTTGVLLYAGRPYCMSAISALTQKQVNMDVPVSLALLLAYLYSCWATWHGSDVVYFDSINMFLFLLTLGRFVESKARHHAQAATEALWEMVPEMAQKKNDQGQIEHVNTRDLKIGDQVIVAHGEPMPADLLLLSPSATMDESLLTGESKPVEKQINDMLYAGTVNLGPALSGKVDQTDTSTRLGQLQQLLIQAQLSRPRIAQLADKVAGHFIAALLLFSTLIGSFWYFVDASRVVPIVVSVLIVTCPCALSLATPTALAAVMARLARQGIVVSRSNALETLRHVSAMIFDKTGTLTRGAFGLSHTVCFNQHQPHTCLAIARALEAGETHPIAKAFQQGTVDETAETANNGANSHASEVRNNVVNNVVKAPFPFQQANEKAHHPGRGISGMLGGQRYWLGAGDQLRKLCPDLPACPKSTHLDPSATPIFLATATEWLACFYLQDQVKPEAADVIKQLQARYPITLASGDNAQTVACVARQLNITDHLGRCAPEAKSDLIQQAQQEGQRVLMVGDGANDGPVLAQADVGVAMGQGAALAHASADIILLTSDLRALPQLFQAANDVHRIIRQNLLWAILYNCIALPFAAAGLVPAWAAAIGMSCSSLAVVLNSMRLVRSGTQASPPSTEAPDRPLALI